MKNHVLIKVHYVKPSEHALSVGVKPGDVIAMFIYKTESHALALHQCRKDNPSYKDDIVLDAVTIDVEDEDNKELYDILDANEQVLPVFGW